MRHTLLLADDSVTIQRVIELTFADEDVSVVVAGDGKQAIDRVLADPPDIVLADIGMPERDGYEVAAFVKRDPRYAHIPVILLTGAFEPLDETRAREVGCDGVLVKPFEPQMVINRVKDLLTGVRRVAAAAPAPVQEPDRVPVVPPPSQQAESPSSHAPVPAVVRHDAPPPATEPAAPSGRGDALEDYFDRLDAAFANIGVSPPGAAPGLEPIAPDLSGGIRELHREPVQSPAPGGDPLASWDPELAADFGPARQPQLANAFAALLAAEEGGPAVDTPPAPAMPPAVSEELVEEVVRRVLVRMGDETMRQLVLDTAERLVREEIERIKRDARQRTAAAPQIHP